MLVLLLAAGQPQKASAAPCQAPDFSGNLTIVGAPAMAGGCTESSETFNVYCSAGNVFVDYGTNDSIQGPINSGVPCSSPTRIAVDGYLGGDRIDLSRVSPANGFTGIGQPNLLLGSFGNDLLIGSPLPDTVDGSVGADLVLVRDGSPDTVDCGADVDFAQGDQQGTDTFANCEFADFLPAPVQPATVAQTTVRKCKKKRRSAVVAKKKRCKKRRRSAR